MAGRVGTGRFSLMVSAGDGKIAHTAEGVQMKKIALFALVILVLAGCSTMTRYIGGYSPAPFIGESEADFRYSCPFLYHINETVTRAGTTRQYVFQAHVRPRYVYFENGVLVAMQN
jgi:hypothetical protein